MRKTLLALSLVALIGSINVTEYINSEEARAQEVTRTEVTETVEAEDETTNDSNSKGKTETDYFWFDMGQFEITAYCVGTCCSSGTGITKSGRPAVVGTTIGVDENIIPLGSKVKIVFEDGTEHVYRADDTGSAIKGEIIDLLCDSHESALQFGRQTCRVYVQEVNDPRN